MKGVKGFMPAENHPSWRGDNVGYRALHAWIGQRKPKPELCECCHTRPPRDLSNISGEYKRDLEDFAWLCRGCHLRKDGWLEKHLELLHKALANRTHCKRGHPFSETNTYRTPAGERRCRQCAKDRACKGQVKVVRLP